MTEQQGTGWYREQTDDMPVAPRLDACPDCSFDLSTSRPTFTCPACGLDLTERRSWHENEL